MSLLAAAENRSKYRAAYLPETVADKPMQWLLDVFGGGKTRSGVSVDADNMVSLATVFAALNYIQDTMASLPCSCMIKEEHPDIKTGKYRRKHTSHPSHRLVAWEPNRFMTSHTYNKLMMNQVLRYDNAFAFISRDQGAKPKQLIPLPLHLYNVQPQYLEGSGDLIYKISGRKVPLDPVYIPSGDMIHIVGYTEDGYIGKSRAKLMKEALGNSVAAENWVSDFFGKGINSSGFIKTPKKLGSEEAVHRLKTSFAQVAAGANNQFGVGVLEDGAEWVKNEIDPDKVELSQTRKINAVTVSQIWKIPIVFLNHLERATFNNMEQLGIWFSVYTLGPWCRNFEQEYQRKLLREDEKDQGNIYYKYDLKSLMRGDMNAFSQFVERMQKTGAYSPNMILELMDENGFPGGDVHVINPGASTVEQLTQ